MRHSHTRRRWRGPVFCGLLFLLTLGALSAFDAPGQASPFGGDDRYLGHVSTDKPIYRGGETAYFRTVVLHAFDRTPARAGGRAHIKVKNSRGSAVMETYFEIEGASGGANWDIPAGTPGGEYTAEISFPNHGFPTVERKFDVRAYRAPRIKTQLEFLRKAYGPGDTVTAVMTAERAEGGIPEGAAVTAIARIDGEEAWRGNATVNARGDCTVRFDLPADIKEGVGSLTLVIEDGGVLETASKTLPILLQEIPVSFFPEGGDLVAGLECGLYFEALTPWGDPADIKGQIVDADGAAVADFATTHEGRGRVSFTPSEGATYFARITEPAGISKLEPLPEVRASGVSLRATLESYEAVDAMTFDVAAAEEGEYMLALYHREREVSALKVDLTENETQSVTLTPASTVDGVLRATLLNAEGEPLAERLVFRKPARQLNIEIESSPKNAVPGDKVELTVRTTTPDGKPVSAMVGLTVTDESVLEMIETRKQAPRLPVMAFLENEVDHLEDAHVYLSDDPEAAPAVDLLLGTQGWRRFAYYTPEEFMKEHADKAKRAIAFRESVDPTTSRVGLGGGMGGGARGAREDDGAAAPDAEGAEADNVAKGDPGQNEVEDQAQGQDPEEAEIREPVAKVADRDDEMPEAEEPGRRMERRAMPAVIRIREYAHQLREGRQPGDRRDFTETVYWNAGLQTDDKGEAKVSFYLSDSVTSFRVMADGYTSKGALGQADAVVTSRAPFYVEPKLPLEVTSGDTVLIPVSLVNGTDGGMKVVLEAESGKAISLPENFKGELALQADERGRLLLPVTAGHANGKVSLTLAGKAGSFSDRVTREIAVRPLGFPMSYSVGGMLEKPQAIKVTIPEDVHATSITTSAKVYPTPAANMMAAVERLIREPYG